MTLAHHLIFIFFAIISFTVSAPTSERKPMPMETQPPTKESLAPPAIVEIAQEGVTNTSLSEKEATEKPVEAHQEPKDEENTPGSFQGDMMLTVEQMEEVRQAINDQKSGRTKRKATSNGDYRWPNNVIPYVISQSSAADAAVIREAMDHWEAHTCLRFEPRASSHVSYLSFIRGIGCWSPVGRTSLGAQPISIGEGCASLGIIAHEIGHAIGFHHEQSRPDRDDYITINYENIRPDFTDQFAKYSWGQVTALGVEYDVGSIMHYGPNTWSRNDQPTITTNDPLNANLLGNRAGLSFADIQLANRMYGCGEDCPNARWTRCRNGGYLGPECVCVCPLGFTGERCEIVDEMAEDRRGCVQLLTDREGEITSPNFPANYGNNMNCLYLIEGPVGSTIELAFLQLNVEFHALCKYDSVEIRRDDVHQPGEKFCGSRLPPLQSSTDNRMLVSFVSDRSVTRQGFRASYVIIGGNDDDDDGSGSSSSVEVDDDDGASSSIGIDDFEGTCGGYFSEDRGTLASPNYPNNYQNNINCVFTIEVAVDMRVELRLFDFQLESQDRCAWDALTFKLDSTVKVPMAFCGGDFPDAPIVSIRNRMVITLKTDSSRTARGFAAAYRAIE